ncbi:MAG: GGDEF domain-containing protein [Spirochaetia bacterium]|nr:GGDEF domain-containing protein [Spirochaetia bacterium]
MISAVLLIFILLTADLYSQNQESFNNSDSQSSLAATVEKSGSQIHAFFLTEGILIGIIAGLILYNLFLYSIIKNSNHLLFSAAFFADFFFFLSFSAVKSEITGQIAILFTFTGMIFAALSLSLHAYLVWNFVKIQSRKNPFLRYSFYIFPLLTFLILLLSAAGFRQTAIELFLVSRFFNIILIFAAIQTFREGFRYSGYLIASLLSGLTGHILSGYFYMYSQAADLSNLLLVSFYALEALLMSFAVSFSIQSLRDETSRAVQKKHVYREMSFKDELTGVYNKRYYLKRITEEKEQSQKNIEPLSLVILDIDDFKMINDTFGHPEGDRILKVLSNVITSNIRSSDIACRFGGEEFIVILPGTRKKDAESVMKNILETFSKTTQRKDIPVITNLLHFIYKKKAIKRCTFSSGIAELMENESEEELLQRADNALYEAKKKGKNRIIIDG